MATFLRWVRKSQSLAATDLHETKMSRLPGERRKVRSNLIHFFCVMKGVVVGVVVGAARHGTVTRMHHCDRGGQVTCSPNVCCPYHIYLREELIFTLRIKPFY